MWAMVTLAATKPRLLSARRLSRPCGQVGGVYAYIYVGDVTSAHSATDGSAGGARGSDSGVGRRVAALPGKERTDRLLLRADWNAYSSPCRVHERNTTSKRNHQRVSFRYLPGDELPPAEPLLPAASAGFPDAAAGRLLPASAAACALLPAAAAASHLPCEVVHEKKKDDDCWKNCCLCTLCMALCCWCCSD
ncbi:hypothetical protein MTO96_017461 [Rhipicephalus appendiculatus]